MPYPGTCAAGYNRRTSRIAGEVVENENSSTFRIDGGAWFDIDDVRLLAYKQELDLRRAVQTRLWAQGFTVSLLKHEHPETGSFSALGNTALLVHRDEEQAVREELEGLGY